MTDAVIQLFPLLYQSMDLGYARTAREPDPQSKLSK